MINNTLKIDGHMAVITFDPEIEMFRGEFVALNGGADFYVYSVDELKKDGIEPYKLYSGNEIRGF
ncbi:type II toxin-antitoxin system HicB family antitoxin [Photorhabdus akhurstii]|uniref:type II toxin-antitoxin system HicB family antitoxin n=1 Tax=Photorhabdus akhurstii TaxID=171438 RepID=UPI0006921324|nr:type II toxin-antitoxin system HicB family antitoxin [Photorhabdus akhurstii]MBS9430320.1 type II toxin-antitoxin system HicB family antitoxin [Photorhabdus akhurstii]PQQ42055.1 type II toxin-antitoxin system HicB family antitoxin [Photorhabdus luminescens]